MFISKKRYEEEQKFMKRRMNDFEKTLHELYAEHLELREKYNWLLSRMDTIELDTSLRIGDRGK